MWVASFIPFSRMSSAPSGQAWTRSETLEGRRETKNLRVDDYPVRPSCDHHRAPCATGGRSRRASHLRAGPPARAIGMSWPIRMHWTAHGAPMNPVWPTMLVHHRASGRPKAQTGLAGSAGLPAPRSRRAKPSGPASSSGAGGCAWGVSLAVQDEASGSGRPSEGPMLS